MNDILFGNNNRPIIEKLSKRYFKASKSRNIITIIAIILTTVLFTTIFTLGSGMIDISDMWIPGVRILTAAILI